jgi:hypothetical protein
MKLFIKLFTLFIINCSISFGQSAFREGFIINHKGDTIKGHIKVTGPNELCENCEFRLKPDSESTDYSPEQITAFGFNTGEFFTSKNINKNTPEELVFVEYLVDGIVDLYAYAGGSNLQYYIETTDGDLVELKNTQKEIYQDNDRYLKDRKEYIGTLKVLFKDYPAIYKDINNINLDHKPLIKLAENYHNAVCDEYQCLIYKKNTNTKTYIGITGGMNYSSIKYKAKQRFFQHLEDENFTWQRGYSIYLSLSKNNIFGLNKRYTQNINIGYIQNNFQSNQHSIQQHKIAIPLFMDYNFSLNKFSPFISFGFNNVFTLKSKYDIFHNTNNHYGVAGMLGSDVSNNEEEILLKTNGLYEFRGLLGFGLKYKYHNTVFTLKTNYQLGTGINEFGHIDLNLVSTTTQNYTITFGIKHLINK